MDSSQWLRKPGPRGNYGGSWTLGFELTAGVGAEGVATNNFARAPFRPRLGWQILEPPHSLHVLSGAGAEGRASAVPSLHLPLSAPLALVRADAGALALFACALDALVRAEAGASAILAPVLPALVRADAGALAILAPDFWRCCWQRRPPARAHFETDLFTTGDAGSSPDSGKIWTLLF